MTAEQKAKASSLRDELKSAHANYTSYVRQFKKDANARWDATATSGKRKTSFIETTDETGSASTQLNTMSRLLAIALCRDGVRNFSSAKAILRQIKLNVVGSAHDVKVSAEGGESAEFYFNKVWSMNADFRGNRHLSDMNGMAFESLYHSGDVLQLFDRYILGTGRLVWYESDQICDTDQRILPKGCTSDDGVIRDVFGREVGYVVNTKSRGMSSVDPRDAVLLMRDPVNDDNNYCSLIKMPWRLNQSRGIPEMLTCIADLMDCYEMRAKELQTAKVAASMAGQVIKNTEDSDGWAGSEFNPKNMDDGTETDDEPPADQSPVEPKRYERFGALTGGMLEYMEDGEKFELFDINRPNINGADFSDRVIASSGSALGLAKAYAKLEASASYTAFRGEMVMTWVMFEYLQTFFERYIQLWQAIRAIRYGIATGKCDAPAKGWEYTLSFQHPRTPQVDGVDEQEAITRAIRNGLADLSKYVGPDWKKTVDRIAEQKAYCTSLGVVISGLNDDVTLAAPDKLAREARRKSKDGE